MKKIQTLSARVMISVISVIMIIFLSFAGMFSYWSYERMIKEYQQVLQTYTANVDAVFGHALDGIQTFMEWLYSEPEGVKARHKDEYVVAENAGLIKKVLDRSEPYYQSAFILNDSCKITFLAGNGVSFPANLENSIELKAGEQERGLNAVVWTTESRYENEQDINLCSFFFQEAKSNDAHYMGAVNVNIDLDALSKHVFNRKTEEGLKAYIINQRGQIVAHSNGENIGKNISEYSYIQQILTGESIYDSVEIEGTKAQIMSFESAEKGYYIVVQSTYLNLLASTVNTIPLGILCVIFVCAVILVCIVFGKMFRPLNELTLNMRSEYESEYEIEKIYDDVSFLKRYYALNREYIQMLRSKEYKNLVVKSLLQETWTPNMEKYIGNKNIVAADREYCVVMVQLLTEEMQEEDIISLYLKCRENVETAFERTLSKERSCVCLELGLKRLLFVLSASDKADLSSDCMMPKLEEISGELREKQQIEIQYAVSDATTNHRVAFDQLYRQAKDRMKAEQKPVEEESCDDQNKPMEKNRSNQERIEVIVDFLNNNYQDKEINVSTLANRFHMDKGYLGKLFLDYTGMNLNNYLMDIRMKRARDILMTYPDKSVSQVAEEVGFSSNTYFATCFRKYYGISPSKMWPANME